jgi:formyl-CoA transferase
MSLPLEGIKVVDFTGVQAGPACTQLLAWFGADVLKVERPGVGDVTRRQLRDVPDLDALYFITLNSNKKSLTLNTKTPEGKAIMEKLIREADVLVENFAPGAMDRMGLHLGAHSRTQPADHLRLDQGLQRRLALRGPQGL